MERFLPSRGADQEIHRPHGSIASMQLAINGIRLASLGDRLAGPAGHIEDVFTYRILLKKVITEADATITGAEAIKSADFRWYFPTPPTLFRGNATLDGTAVMNSLMSGSFLIGNSTGKDIAELSVSRDDNDELEFKLRQAQLFKDLPKQAGQIISDASAQLILRSLLQCTSVDPLRILEADSENLFKMLLTEADAFTKARSALYEWEDMATTRPRELQVHDRTTITTYGTTTTAYQVGVSRNFVDGDTRTTELVTARYTDESQEGYTARLKIGVSGENRAEKSSYFAERKAALECGGSFERVITDACTYVADLTSDNVHRAFPALGLD